MGRRDGRRPARLRQHDLSEEAAERGLEPDECYVLGPRADEAPPHVAIEVIVGRPLVDKLAVYAGLGVSEVWVWRTSVGQLHVHKLIGDRYERRQRSELFPGLDFELVARFVRPGESHTALVKGYRAALRGAP